MATFTSHTPGTPSWTDLMSPDVDASKAFYTSVFGWDAADQFDDAGNRVYVMFSLDGKSVAGLGGMAPNMDGMPAIWNTYITTDDVAATASKVEAAGGAVAMPPMQVMTSGEMAVFADPTGAMFSVWKAGDHIGAEVSNVANTMSWNELMTSDTDAAKGFYAEVFGWTYQDMEMGEMGTYHLIEGGTNDEGLGGMIAKPAEMAEVPNHWAVYFTVDDIEATIVTATEAGGTVLQEPFPVPGIGISAVVGDPHHGVFQLMQPAAQE